MGERKLRVSRARLYARAERVNAAAHPDTAHPIPASNTYRANISFECNYTRAFYESATIAEGDRLLYGPTYPLSGPCFNSFPG